MTTDTMRPIVPTWTLADRLRKAREQAGMGQDDIAARLGVTRQSVGNWENGRRNPKRATLLAWAWACGVDADWLMGDIGQGGDTCGYPPVWFDVPLFA